MKMLHIRWTRGEVIADNMTMGDGFSELKIASLDQLFFTHILLEIVEEYIDIYDKGLKRYFAAVHVAIWAFGPEGIPSLQLLALGDFSPLGREVGSSGDSKTRLPFSRCD
jgi:hypothetical protein